MNYKHKWDEGGIALHQEWCMKCNKDWTEICKKYLQEPFRQEIGNSYIKVIEKFFQETGNQEADCNAIKIITKLMDEYGSCSMSDGEHKMKELLK